MARCIYRFKCHICEYDTGNIPLEQRRGILELHIRCPKCKNINYSEFIEEITFGMRD